MTMTVDDALAMDSELAAKSIKCQCIDCEARHVLALEVARLRSEQVPTVAVEPIVSSDNRCNLHKDCAAADTLAKSLGTGSAPHCDDPYCEDCFGS